MIVGLKVEREALVRGVEERGPRRKGLGEEGGNEDKDNKERWRMKMEMEMMMMMVSGVVDWMEGHLSASLCRCR
jgi:hypothetical protein